MRDNELSNIDVVLYALYKLDGHMRKVHTEEIAYESYMLAKERFGWRLQRFHAMGFPDKEPVRISLMDAAKEKYGILVSGRAGVEASGKEIDGWMFTPEGASWIRQNEKRIEEALGIEKPKTSKKEADRFLREMKEQSLFKSFMQAGNLSNQNSYAFTDMLDTGPDSPKEVITKKFDRLRTMAQLVGDKEIIRFLECCAETFPDLLASLGSEKK